MAEVLHQFAGAMRLIHCRFPIGSQLPDGCSAPPSTEAPSERSEPAIRLLLLRGLHLVVCRQGGTAVHDEELLEAVPPPRPRNLHVHARLWDGGGRPVEVEAAGHEVHADVVVHGPGQRGREALSTRRRALEGYLVRLRPLHLDEETGDRHIEAGRGQGRGAALSKGAPLEQVGELHGGGLSAVVAVATGPYEERDQQAAVLGPHWLGRLAVHHEAPETSFQRDAMHLEVLLPGVLQVQHQAVHALPVRDKHLVEGAFCHRLQDVDLLVLHDPQRHPRLGGEVLVRKHDGPARLTLQLRRQLVHAHSRHASGLLGVHLHIGHLHHRKAAGLAQYVFADKRGDRDAGGGPQLQLRVEEHDDGVRDEGAPEGDLHRGAGLRVALRDRRRGSPARDTVP
mmetsp:Transcript_15309/g.42277  ORF Transcript_15309/g.42277 Transcript_15309/m.42277 type:complete len:396 (-) Transcript_15309:1076-2263(-)